MTEHFVPTSAWMATHFKNSWPNCLEPFFKINSRTSPDYMTEHFVPTSAVHSCGTRIRENGNFSLPQVKGFGKKTFALRGCELWKDLPTSIKSIAHNHSFKVAVKAHFLNLL